MQRGAERGRHAGEIELKKLGHLLHAYVPAIGGRIPAPRYLEVEAGPTLGSESCGRCGATGELGEVSVRNLDKGRAVQLPFIAVHALASHGERFYEGSTSGIGAIDVDALKDVLNYEEYRIGRLLTALLAHTALVPDHLAIAEEMAVGVVSCGECGDPVRLGSFTVRNCYSGASTSIPYLGLHALVEHKDARFSALAVDGGVSEGGVAMRLVREILGRSPAYQALGARIAGFVSARGFGGAEPCPQHLVVREHPAGEEVCAACGEVLDGGTFELRNIHTGHEMHLPYLALHALMSHGEAFYEGGRGRGWVDVPVLQRLTKRTWPMVQRLHSG
ncbi:MAG: hypothetical protein IPK80_33990 [Nannocystis sp.]|nr:hypothetical protein [Nannocystis sp.]